MEVLIYQYLQNIRRMRKQRNCYVLTFFFVWMLIDLFLTVQGSEVKDLSTESISSFKKEPISLDRQDFEEDWKQYKFQYLKKYISDFEEVYRKNIFKKNQQKIRFNNLKKKFRSQSNEFIDLDEDQFVAKYAKLLPSNKVVKQTADLIRRKKQIEDKNCFCEEENQIEYEEIIKQLKHKEKKISQITTISGNKVKVEIKTQSKGNLTDHQSDNNQYFLEKSTDPEANEEQVILSSKGFQQKSEVNYNVDWTNYMGPVRHQGLCGVCYAFAAVQNLQFLLNRYIFGFTVELSVQQVIDCDQNGLSFGCNGGYLESPFLFLQTAGVETSFMYPYVSGETGYTDVCKSTNGPFKIAHYKEIAPGHCTELKKQLLSKPISVGIASRKLQFYGGGVFDQCDEEINHAVLLIGYSQGIGWKIKNSWGSDWGENGYAWIDEQNNCGICTIAIVPYLSEENTSF